MVHTDLSKPSRFFTLRKGAFMKFTFCNFHIVTFFLLSCFSLSTARIVKLSSNTSNPQAVINTSLPGDIILIDIAISTPLSNPPSGTTIVGGRATWNLTNNLSDILFYEHHATLKQTAGSLRRIICNRLQNGSSFTHIDSCLFICTKLGTGRSLTINGFLRSSTFLFDPDPTGGTRNSLQNSSIRHTPCFLINATDPIGDGSGTYISGMVIHNQVDYTPIKIINGRGIQIAHPITEYVEWADPIVQIENGVDCAIINPHPGGGNDFDQDWKKDPVPLNDSTFGYKPIAHRLGIFRIGGFNNSIIGGDNYSNYNINVTPNAWTAIITRDPYLTKWKTEKYYGINYAPALCQFSWLQNDPSNISSNNQGSSYTIGSYAACTTTYIDQNGNLNATHLKPKSIPLGPSLYKPYFPQLPPIPLKGAGIGINMTNKPIKEIMDSLALGKTIYLDSNVYEFTGTIKNGTIWGAGQGKTILKFPPLSTDFQGNVSLYNLTIDGGDFGYKQDSPGTPFGLSGSLIEFRNQTFSGIDISNTQQRYLQFMKFNNIKHLGVSYCRPNSNLCSEKPTDPNDMGAKIADKFYFYGCTFNNSEQGIWLKGNRFGDDGFFNIIGCSFTNHSKSGISLDAQGVTVAGCTFTNAGPKAAYVKHNGTIHNCTFKGNPSDIAASGKWGLVISSSFQGFNNPIQAVDSQLISDVLSTDGTAPSGKIWISNSKFSNKDLLKGNEYNGTILTSFTNQASVSWDNTPPSQPQISSVTSSGNDNIIQWSASEDLESGVYQYIVERKGEEIFRSSLNYPITYHATVWPDLTYPGPGVYRKRALSFSDKDAVGKYSSADYYVYAINGTLLRSDSKTSKVILWHDRISPLVTESSLGQRISDSIVVPKTSIYDYPSAGSVSYDAVIYSPYSKSGLQKGINSNPSDRVINPFKDKGHTLFKKQNSENLIFDIRGRTIRFYDLQKNKQGLSQVKSKVNGIYIIGKQKTIITNE